MHKITSRWGQQDQVRIEWNLGKQCNYDCSYCPAEIHDYTSPHTDITILKSVVDNLSVIPRPVRISFTGGEPTVHPQFKELVDYVKYKGIYWINLTTNGTKSPDYYINLNADHIVFSLHFEYNWQRAMNTIVKVNKESNKAVMVNVMVHPDHVDKAKLCCSKFQLAGVKYTLRRIRWTQGDHDLFDDMRYHPDDLEWMLNVESTAHANCEIDDGEAYVHANDIIKNKLNKFNNWSCMAGIESLMINWDGTLYRATCRVGDSLGNIYENNFTFPTEPITCTRQWCTCAADIPLTKFSL